MSHIEIIGCSIQILTKYMHVGEIIIRFINNISRREKGIKSGGVAMFLPIIFFLDDIGGP